MRIFIILFVLLVIVSCKRDENILIINDTININEIRRINIHYLGWGVISESKYSIEDVRVGKKMLATIKNKKGIKELFTVLDFKELNLQYNRIDDYKVVIDIYLRNNSIITIGLNRVVYYYEGSEHIYSLDKQTRDSIYEIIKEYTVWTHPILLELDEMRKQEN